ncbi:MAG: electron transfer flavoprotein subunit alpha/FixB family protein [Phycisphaerae bacterium]|jgi:electron transfer flavoprotein alpha subunit
MIEVNKQGEVWVFAEQHAGKIEDIAFELLGRGRKLANELNVPLGAVMMGNNVKPVARELIRYGADKVYVADNNLLEHFQTNSYAKVMCDLIELYKPQIVIYGATPVGRDFAPRVASKMKAGLTADCTDLQIGSHEIKKTGVKHENLLLQIRPAFGGNIIATIINYDRWPQMATVREGVMPMPETDNSRKGEVIDAPVNLSTSDLPIEIIEEVRRQKAVNLKASRIIVAGGAGVGSKENFNKVWELANALGGVPGATRAAADLGYISKDYQIGQTGTTVRPSLYIAVGISGAIQHQAGMAESKKIIAINNDPSAPIFNVAHYKICGDLNEVLPMMIKAVKEKV